MSNDLKKLDVGCGTAKVEGAIGIDRAKLPGVDVVHDLNQFPWPFDDATFDEIYMHDVIEHIDDTIAVMEEVHRLLKKGGKLYIRVVYWNHMYSFSDPTHVKVFTEVSFDFFTGKRRNYYTDAQFEMLSCTYTYDRKARRIFRFEWLMKKLSYFLCNIIDGMHLVLQKV